MSRLSFRNTNQKRRMQANARQRQNATHRSMLLRDCREETDENPQDTPETSSSVWDNSTNPTRVPVTNKKYAAEISDMIS